jgi:N,N'-diacetyllegionaminate synthase
VDKKVLFIAEAGVNHNGDMNIAKQLIDVASRAGADIVKFQTFKADSLVTVSAKMADYQIQNIKTEDTQFNMLRKLELSDQNFIELQKYAKQKGIRFLSTAFDMESLVFLKKLQMGLWKVPSGEITNLPYLEFVGRCQEPVLLSTGMATLNEVHEAVNALVALGLSKDKITVLHCTTDYPTPFRDVHLSAMLTLKREIGVEVGYSDHTLGMEVSTAAVALGARVIEKHFTLDRNMPGPDHKASLEPKELQMLVAQIRNLELALGHPEKKPTETEIKNRAVARKSIVANLDIRLGEVFTSENLTTKRPGTGLNPMKWYDVIGQRASRDFKKDELIEI